MPMTIKLLGEPGIFDELGQVRDVRGFQAWGVLAKILLSRAPVDRRSLSAELFPDSVDPMGSLRWCLAALRKALDDPECLRGDPIESNLRAGIKVDIFDMQGADFDPDCTGLLLGSVEPKCSAEFSTWLLVERERLSSMFEARIRQETLAALSRGDYSRAIHLAGKAVNFDQFNEAAHVLLVKSLVMAGRFDAANRHAEATEAVFLSELGERPSLALRSAARRSVAAPPSTVSLATFVRSLIQSGQAALTAGAIDAGIDCLRRAVADAETTGDQPLFATALLELGVALVHSVRGYDDEGSVFLGQSLMIARQNGIPKIAAVALRELGYVEALAGRRPTAANYLSEARACSENDKATLAGIEAVAGFNLVDWGKVDYGIVHFEQSLDHSRRAGNRRWETWALGIGARGLILSGQFDKAESWLHSCMEGVEELKWMSFQPWPIGLLAECKLQKPTQSNTLLTTLEEAFVHSCQLADPCWEAMNARVIALTHEKQGDPATALQWLEDAKRRCNRETDRYAALEVDILADQARINRQMGQSRQADDVAREWISVAARTHMNAQIAAAAQFLAG